MAILETNNPRKNMLLIGAIFEAAMLITMTCGAWLFGTTVMHAYSSSQWPHTKGKVTVGTDSPQLAKQSVVGSIWYEYPVGAHVYRSNRVTFFQENELYEHKEGQIVTVFYNPDDAADACLVTGVSPEALLRLIAYAASIICGALIIYSLIYNRFIKKPTAGDSKDAVPQVMAASSILRGIFFPW